MTPASIAKDLTNARFATKTTKRAMAYALFSALFGMTVLLYSYVMGMGGLALPTMGFVSCIFRYCAATKIKEINEVEMSIVRNTPRFRMSGMTIPFVS